MAKYLGRGQLAECQRCGEKGLAQNLMRDGRNPQLLVFADCYDPPHDAEKPFKPKQVEGKPKFPVSPENVKSAQTQVVVPGVGIVDPLVLSGATFAGPSNRLSWTPLDNSTNTTAFKIYRDDVLIETFEVEYDDFAALVAPLEFDDEDVVYGETYEYRVVAVPSLTESNTIELTPLEYVRLSNQTLTDVTPDGSIARYELRTVGTAFKHTEQDGDVAIAGEWMLEAGSYEVRWFGLTGVVTQVGTGPVEGEWGALGATGLFLQLEDDDGPNAAMAHVYIRRAGVAEIFAEAVVEFDVDGTAVPAPTEFDLIVVNPGAETTSIDGDAIGWSQDVGALGSYTLFGPPEGIRAFTSEEAGEAILTQRIDFADYLGDHPNFITDIDLGILEIVPTWWGITYIGDGEPYDTVEFRIHFYDAGDVLIANYVTGPQTPDDVPILVDFMAEEFEIGVAAIPPLARYIIIELNAQHQSVHVTNTGSFDDIRLTVRVSP